MRLLDFCSITHRGATRRVELFYGNLARIPRKHAVDLLVVSAFPSNYSPTNTSLIGALDRAGLSVEALAQNKFVDLRQEFGCWVSQSVDKRHNFGKILCIESAWRGAPPETTDDIFRALAVNLLSEFANSSIAMPVVGAGNQQYPFSDMLDAILKAAYGWIFRGLSLKCLKIVIYREADIPSALKIFHENKPSSPVGSSIYQFVRSLPRLLYDIPDKLRILHAREHYKTLIYEYGISFKNPIVNTVKATHSLETKPVHVAKDATDFPKSVEHEKQAKNIFISYSHDDTDAAQIIFESLKTSNNFNIFYDRESIPSGSSWLIHVAPALDSADRVVAVYSEKYWKSKNCMLEFAGALTRQSDQDKEILYPIYISDAQIPYIFRHLIHHDCRVRDRSKIVEACANLIKTLNG
jgi:hypothetical protein